MPQFCFQVSRPRWAGRLGSLGLTLILVIHLELLPLGGAVGQSWSDPAQKRTLQQTLRAASPSSLSKQTLQ